MEWVSTVRGERALKGQTTDVPDEHVEGEEDDENEAREEGGREQRAPLPLLALHMGERGRQGERQGKRESRVGSVSAEGQGGQEGHLP